MSKVITGTIFTGHNSCSKDCNAGLYKEEVLGFEPFPGSLNIKVDAGIVAMIERQYKKFLIQYDENSSLWLWNASIESVPCMIMWPRPCKTNYIIEQSDIEEKSCLEVFAPFHLRTLFNLKDDDQIQITIENKYLNADDYFHQTELHQHEAHWSAFEKRWEYHNKTIELLNTIEQVRTILEAGTMGVKIWKHSDTIDLDLPPNWPLYYTPTFNYDLNKTPWSCIAIKEDSKYDVFIALRVFHQLNNKHQEYFNEMKRIANHIILALPESIAKCYKDIQQPLQEIKCQGIDTIVLLY
jgi:hypothetical protein